jgi:hypothetical protein
MMEEMVKQNKIKENVARRARSVPAPVWTPWWRNEILTLSEVHKEKKLIRNDVNCYKSQP